MWVDADEPEPRYGPPLWVVLLLMLLAVGISFAAAYGCCWWLRNDVLMELNKP